jgi:hypothetical protein
MKWWVLGLVLVTACATASTEGVTDGSPDGLVKRDAGPDAPPDATSSVCPSTETCAGAMMLGSVSGDTNNVKLSAAGYRAAWYRVRVTEDNSGIVGLSLRMAAKLTAPPGVNFDAFVYVNTGSDVVECTTTAGSPVTNGATEQTRIEWGEGTISNGNDDGRSVSIEIRPISGTCAPTSMWQLEIEGNWL